MKGFNFFILYHQKYWNYYKEILFVLQHGKSYDKAIEFIPNHLDWVAPLDIGIIVVPSTLILNQVGNMFK